VGVWGKGGVGGCFFCGGGGGGVWWLSTGITGDRGTACFTNKKNRFPCNVFTLYGFRPFNCMKGGNKSYFFFVSRMVWEKSEPNTAQCSSATFTTCRVSGLSFARNLVSV